MKWKKEWRGHVSAPPLQPDPRFGLFLWKKSTKQKIDFFHFLFTQTRRVMSVPKRCNPFSLSLYLTHTISLSLSLSLTHTHTHTHTYTYTYTHTHTHNFSFSIFFLHEHALSLSLYPSNSNTQTHTHFLCHPHIVFYSFSDTFFLSHTRTHIYTHTHIYHVHTLSFSFFSPTGREWKSLKKLGKCYFMDEQTSSKGHGFSAFRSFNLTSYIFFAFAFATIQRVN